MGPRPGTEAHAGSPARPIALELIPYYAWANREPSEMTVWLPFD